MALSDAQWLAWLEDESKDAVILVEANYYDTTEKTLYISDSGYIDPEDVDAPNYLAVITSDVVIDDQLGEVGFSDIVFTNYDDAILDYQFVGFVVKIFYGDRSWPRDDFRQKGYTRTDDFTSPDPFSYQLKLLNSSVRYFDQLIQVQTSSGDNIGLPFVLGSPTNITPRREDTTTYILYTPAVSLTTNFVVRDQGVVLTITTDYTISYEGEDVDAAGYKYAINLVATPNGEITCDPVSASAADNDLSAIIESLSDYLANPIVVDSSVIGFDGKELGYLLTDFTRLGDVLSDLCHSFGANPRVNQNGELSVVQINVPGTPTRTINSLLSDMSLIKREAKARGLVVGYQKNWTIQSTNLAGSLSATDYYKWGVEYYFRVGFWLTSLAEYPFETPIERGTAITNFTDATTEFNRLNTILGSERRRFEFEADVSSVYDDLGDTVEIVYEHFGLSEGDDFVVIGNQQNLSKKTCKVTVWH